ncbi:hypothetical protein [Polynucleobacter sp. MWH-Berg-3C6]|uniref:hypothetical protein n=1 Tax=Polynucleobacter sp. MWH-Berg-3C6 TaxID=1855882 RepID=UPI001C0E396B|nr:hypothetical protein [Polynucleobacter sp. MWH-Berg-3C6]MBU3551658.1 hypothetical protein [Polynucleobacter sp. MWH-Berg-3C6]
MHSLKINLVFIIYVLFIPWSVKASEVAIYQDWHVLATPTTIEAYTSPNPNSSFGLYCNIDQCMFYLHDALLCRPGAVSPVLMSSIQSASSLSMRCSLIGAKLFQILDPFTTVLNTLRSVGIVSFAVPLQNGTFGLATFSLQGADAAIKRALLEAAASKNRATPQSPSSPSPSPAIPGAKKLQDISI